MISESLYDEQFQSKFDSWKENVANSLKELSVPRMESTDLAYLIELEKEVLKKISVATSMSLQRMTFDPIPIVQEYYSTKRAEIASSREREIQRINSAKEQKISDHQSVVKKVLQHNESLTAYAKSKHQMLLSFKGDLQDTFNKLDITPMDINISDDVTTDEFTQLLEEAIVICEKYTKKEMSRVKLFADRLKAMDTTQALGIIALCVIVIYLTLPFISVYLFYKMYTTAHNLGMDIDKLRMAYALMAEVDYNRFVDEKDVQQLPELNLEDFDDMLESCEDIVYDATEEMEAIQRAIAAKEEYTRLISDVYREQSMKLNDMLDSLNILRTEIEEQIEEAKKKIVRFPDVQDTSVAFNRSFVVGRYEGVTDVRVTLPPQNLTFANIDLLRLYLCNALLSVRPRNLGVSIYDPFSQCAEFTDFMNRDTADVIVDVPDLSKHLTFLRAEAQKCIRRCGRDAIDEYNKKAEELEMVPVTYRLLILISDFDKLFAEDSNNSDSNVFREFCKYSASRGVTIWVLSPKEIKSFTHIDKYIGTTGTELTYDEELGCRAVKTFTTSLREFKDRGIAYEPKLMQKYFPKPTWHTKDTIKGVDIYFGLEDGDPTKGDPITLGDANVHAIMGGGTGAGKSAELNQIIVSLAMQYPPEELTLVYVDFKNVEAAKFVDQDTAISKIPHTIMLSGTTDGGYALSAFNVFQTEMQRRQTLLGEYGVTKMEELRKQLLQRYNNEHNTKVNWLDIPKDSAWYKENITPIGDYSRWVVIYDEFQAMFNEQYVSSKVQNVIQNQIAALIKLARASGIHFFFASQSMKGTVPADVLANFSLRCALRCTTEVSTTILGNEAAGTILQSFGYMYTNESAGQSPKSNRFWRLPFMPEEDIDGYLESINELVRSRGGLNRRARFYNEKVDAPAELIYEYKQNPRLKSIDRFVLGERSDCVLTPEGRLSDLPYNTTIPIGDSENMCICAGVREDLMWLTLTMLDNLKISGIPYIVNSQDKIVSELMDLDDYITDVIRPFADTAIGPEDILDVVEEVTNERLAAPQGTEHPPLFIVLIGWERLEFWSKYGIDMRITRSLREAPLVNVHYVIVCANKGNIQNSQLALCKHKLCGYISKDGHMFIEEPPLEKLPTADAKSGTFAVHTNGVTTAKIKIFKRKFTKELPQTTLI